MMLSGVGPVPTKPAFKAGGDTLSRHLEELCRAGAWERRKDGDKALLEYIEAEARDLSVEAFGRLMTDVYQRIGNMLLKGNDITRRMGGVLAIDELIDVKLSGDDAAKTARLSGLLSRVLEESEDPALSESAAHTLGHLVRSGGAMTSDIVEKEIRRSLAWCDPRNEPNECRRLTALLVLTEAAESAPAVFNVHVKSFIDAVWFPLRDAKQHIREAAVRALKACLCLVEKRETRYRVQWYYKLHEQTMRGMKRDHRTGALPSPESIHGSLLALAELLQHTGEFMLARYKEVVENVFRYKDSKEKNIRRAVIHLLPRMAAFSPERFASEYLARAIAFLLIVLKNPPERGAAFAALADMAAALARVNCAADTLTSKRSTGFEGCLSPIYVAIREALSAPPAARAAARPRPATCYEALQCVGMLAVALGPLWRPYAAALVEAMVLTGVSEVLVQALTQVANALPELLEDIQYQLLDLLSLVLSKRPFNSSTTQPKFAALSAAIAAGELQGNALTKLALQTLGTFDLGGIQLLEFMRDHILAYTDDPDKEIRQAAVLAACRVLERHAAASASAASAAAAAAGGPPGGARAVAAAANQGAAAAVWHTRVVERCVGRLLVVAVADPSERVRKEVLRALVATTALDDYLAQADCLRALFVGMNDESVAVRGLAIRLVGRLAERNPAHVNPALRKHLLQLLHDMEFSPDNRAREESAFLLEALIAAAARLIMPYVSPIQKALVAKLRGGSGPGILPTGLGGALPLGPAGSSNTAALGSVPSAAGSVLGGSTLLLGGGGGKELGGGGGGLSGISGGVGGGGGKANKAAALQRDLVNENNVIKTVLSTLGALAEVSGTTFRPFISEVMPLVIEAIQDNSDGRRRVVAVKTLGFIVSSCGNVMGPYLEYPQLLSVLLRMLHEGHPAQRREVIKVLGIIGALDPHTHKLNQASLSGEGKLEKEGVRPLRHGGGGAGGGGGGGAGGGGGGGVAGDSNDAGMGGPGDDGGPGGDLLPSSGLVTSSEDYYPTVAINALMRVLRDPALGSQHLAVIRALAAIFRALQLSVVPYLPKVLPILFGVLRGGDEALREEILGSLRALVGHVRQHMRRFLPDLTQLVHEFWPAAPRTCLALIADLGVALRDDVRQYVPELLPKFVAVFAEAERAGSWDLVRPALGALESLGSAVDDSLHLLLPSMVRLISPAASSTPAEVRRAALRSLRRLIPRMQLGGYASAVLHPLIKVLDGHSDEQLRRDALDTICAVAVCLGPEFAIFVPTIRKACQRHRLHHEWFDRLSGKVCAVSPPCMSDAEDWEGAAAGGWAVEIDLLARMQAEGGAAAGGQPPVPPGPDGGAGAKLPVNAAVLRRAWESSHRVTKEDWAEWMRNFAVELLKESPSPALRACHGLAQVHPSMARELFAAGFVSCWAELEQGLQEQLVRSLEAALASPTIPPETVTALLNLAEFMEHDDKRLPLDTRTLGALAEKCHAFAKALHYKELEFQTSPQSAIEALIHINNQLRQPEAAVGVLTYAQKHLHMELKEGWYEKLCRWDEALDAYERRLLKEAPGSMEYHTALLGKMRCLASLAEWENLSNLCRTEWRKSEPHVRREMALIAAHAAWHMGAWDEMAMYVDTVDNPEAVGPNSHTPTGAFLRAVLCVRANQFEAARTHVERTRELMVTDLAALVGESYERAYTDMVRVQQLAELEEVCAYKQALDRRAADPGGSEARIGFIQQLWRDRLRGVQRHVEVWQSLFSIRSLVVPMAQDVGNWLKFASLCRKSGRSRQAYRMLLQLLRYNPMNITQPGAAGYGSGSGAPHVMLAFLKHLWTQGNRTEAYNRIKDLVRELQASAVPPAAAAAAATAAAAAAANGGPAAAAAAAARGGVPPPPGGAAAAGPAAAGAVGAPGAAAGSSAGGPRWLDRPQASLNGRAFLRLGIWQWAMNDKLDNPGVIAENLASFRAATEHAPNWAKAWHQWALFNVAVSAHYSMRDENQAVSHVPPAVQGFFRSVALGQASGDRTGNLQDILRLLTLWFNFGAYAEVRTALTEGFQLVSIDTWLLVIPQIIARIHTHNTDVRQLIHHLLVKIGRHHPQALMYPLLVATKSQSPARRQAAYSVLECIRQHSAALVEQAQLVSGELIRMAILWHEMWHEGLEEASRLYFGESNVEGMLNTLLPLHEMLEKAGPTTLKEIAFVQSYGRELSEAYEWLMKYKASRKEAELHQAWDLYYHVFKRINKQLHSLTTLELQYVSPALVRAQGLELAVPGTYIAGEPLVTIAAFAPQLHVISSKQRPRKLTIHGGDGAEYMFLLKGHEDLRQDERVMQLFGLVNTMLAHDRITAERDLSIARYAVIPLSPNSGLIGWVPNCDTLHALIREYREARKIPLNWEHRLMLGMAPDYDHLTVIQKVEVFEYALDSTSGEDLHKVLWLKSRNSEVWLDRRTNYTRSAAVMSMVGYILGLGDRHPSNLMLDRYSGKLLHIDFGDCFEASMNREKFPEKVPFRLTRMMIKAMEVSGIEGNFRTTCENVMRVLRSNKESVTAMLEAFVHDPLINWRLLNTTEAATEAALARTGADGGGGGGGGGGHMDGPGGHPVGRDALGGGGGGGAGGGGGDPGAMPSPPRRETREKELKEAFVNLGDANEVLNTRAVEVMKRMSDKLMGRDYAPELSVGGGGGAAGIEPDSVPAQVGRLIHMAVNHENLCQSYIGWCPFW